MRHIIVTRFSVPRLDAETAGAHQDPAWLEERLDLFRRYFVPSVGGLGVPAILLCSSQSADVVGGSIRDLPWASVQVQDDWYGGWSGEADQMVTRLDSDDGVHRDWFKALEAAPEGYEAYCTRRFLRYDVDRRRLYARKRKEPSPLAAFPAGRNPYRHDHAKLPDHCRTFFLERAYLLQTVHGGNVSNRRPRWWHARYRVSLELLEHFGVRA